MINKWRKTTWSSFLHKVRKKRKTQIRLKFVAQSFLPSRNISTLMLVRCHATWHPEENEGLLEWKKAKENKPTTYTGSVACSLLEAFATSYFTLGNS